MKSRIQKIDPQKIDPYPRLMIAKERGYIVLMYENGKGVVLTNNCPNHKIGEYSECWATHCFEPFNGEVVLSN